MSIQFKLVERPNPRDLDLPKKHYASIIYGDDVTFEGLAQIISKVSNLNYGSVVGTLATLVEVIEMQLIYGRQVRLNDLGTLYLTISSEGVEDRKSFSVDNIRKANIHFRPGKRIRKLIRNLSFERASTDTAASEEEAEPGS